MGLPPLTHESLAGAPARSRVTVRPQGRTGALVAAGAVLAGGFALLVAYDRLSATAPITADSANAVLQGRAIASGNPLLTGWTLSGASFIGTDLPFYAVLAAIRGLSPAVAHDVGALIYTLLVISACFLARGGSRGVPALGRMAVTLVLLIAPAPGNAVELLLLGPFHAGTTLVMLAGLLVLDAAGDRLWGATLVGVTLVVAVLSDALALYVGAIPVALVAGLRLLQSGGRSRSDVAVLTAAVLAVPASLVAAAALQQLGGFTIVPRQGAFAPIEDMPKNITLTLEGMLLLFGADFFGQPVASVGTLSALVHLAGFAFVIGTFRSVLLAWRRRDGPDRVTQVLVVAMGFDVAAYLLSNQAIDVMTSRYLIPLMAFGAVLAGRQGADWLWSSPWRLRAAAAVAVLYVVFGTLSLRTPAAPTPEEGLEAFLASHHLRYGVSAYWQASTVTVHSGGRVRVRAVDMGAPVPSAYLWEAEVSWYDPRRPGNDARFVLRDTWDSRSVDRNAVEAAFGPPTDDYRVGRYEVLVWDRNLLDQIAH